MCFCLHEAELKAGTICGSEFSDPRRTQGLEERLSTPIRMNVLSVSGVSKVVVVLCYFGQEELIISCLGHSESTME